MARRISLLVFGVGATGLVARGDEAPGDGAVLIDGRGHRALHPVLREFSDRSRRTGVVVDDHEPSLGGRASTRSLSNRTPADLFEDSRPDAGRRGDHQEPRIVRVEQPQARDLIAGQFPDPLGDGVEHLL